MLKIDTCGLSCPEPLILLKKGIAADNDIVLLADSKNSVETCSSFARSKGFSVKVTENGNIFELTIKKD